jgi:prevent-host-death family protein
MREFKAQLARYVRQVKAGGIVTITERGKPIAQIAPVKRSPEERVQAMIHSGRASWSGRRLKPFKAHVRPRGQHTIADLVLENRE